MSNNDLIHDVEDAIRRERTEQMWREYGPYIIGGAVLAVLLTACISGYRAWNSHVNQKNTGLLLSALQSKDEVAALRRIDGKLRPGQRMIDRFTVAGKLLGDKKDEDALKEYRGIAGDPGIPKLYRDLALWLGARLDWSLHPGKAKAQELLDTLKPLVNDNGNPWNAQARMEAAIIAAHGLGDYAQARALLAPALASQNLSDSERQRMQALDHVYSLQQPATPGKVEEKTGSKAVATEDQPG